MSSVLGRVRDLETIAPILGVIPIATPGAQTYLQEEKKTLQILAKMTTDY